VSRYTLHTGDCREVLREYPDSHFDSIVTDPPYGLSFMGKGWDHGVPGEEFWLEALRVAKPGAYLLAFGGTRTFHRLTCAIEDAGWEIRDCVMWVYGSGFPKSLNVGKAIDKAAGAEREKIRIPADQCRNPKATGSGRDGTEGATRPWIEKAMRVGYHEKESDTPTTDEAKQWQGWGTALKPAWEPIIVARKPLAGTVAATVMQYGTGALNIDGCRVGYEAGEVNFDRKQRQQNSAGAIEGAFGAASLIGTEISTYKDAGRWPANAIIDDSPEVAEEFPSDSKGSFSRFFYCAKTSVADREEGLDDLPYGTLAYSGGAQGAEGRGEDAYTEGQGIGLNNLKQRKNTHPTVKPTALMQYLCRLVTQPNGLVLDPFCGSGSTGKAALSEGFRFVGIDLDATHTTIANARCEHAAKKSHTEKLTEAEEGVSIQLNLLDGL
jgi:site-specific DNA-methyltransferase (adenine-specific)